MARTRLDQLGSLQRKVMEVLWETGEATVAQAREALSHTRARHGRGKKKASATKTPAYTTVLSVLQKLTASGWVTYRQEGRTYVYRAARSREEAGASSVRTFVDSVFKGDPMAVFQTLLEDEALDAHQLEELEKLIDDAKRREGGEGP